MTPQKHFTKTREMDSAFDYSEFQTRLRMIDVMLKEEEEIVKELRSLKDGLKSTLKKRLKKGLRDGL